MALTSLELFSSFRAHQPSILKVQGCHSQQAKGRATNRTQTTGDKGGMTGLRRGRMSTRPRFIADVREGKAAHVGLRLQQPRLWVLEPPVAPEVADNVEGLADQAVLLQALRPPREDAGELRADGGGLNDVEKHINPASSRCRDVIPNKQAGEPLNALKPQVIREG